ncbi:LuxR C-terminal-related transcriptional regulator [Streptomyces sp. WMMC897]|uniref:LuxR C-terminal-related transcriptional regulator n=1 Tax=Streptomyces sp. WMMC897 TaxID=3014782 RepID=UPI0022B750F5|nr:LuxR C-terminal-related transcriptional regulator [Streptomyces sp. WMMC897]MCZ7414788.1 LuxR C-terminal-related transcriptional regulator [Streptomyces sp. WMMC897]
MRPRAASRPARGGSLWGLAADDPEPGRRLGAELPWLWHLHRNGLEGVGFLRRALGRAPSDRGHLQARLLTGLALVVDTASPLDQEYDLARQALELATEHGDEELRGPCLSLASVGRFYTDFEAAWELTTQAIRSARAAGDALFVHAQVGMQGMIRHLQDRHDEACSLLESAVDGLRGRHPGIASTALAFLSATSLVRGRPADARRSAEDALELAEPLHDYLRVGIARGALANALVASGDPAGAHDAVRPVRRLVGDADTDVFVPGAALTLGRLCLADGDLDGALRWFERDVRQTDHGAPTYLAAQMHVGYGEALRLAGRIEAARDELDRATDAARRLGMPRTLADALEQQGHLTGDISLRHEALAIRLDHGLRMYWPDSLESLAPAMAAPAAVRVLAAGDRAHEVMGLPRRPGGRRGYDATLAALRDELGAGFPAAWAEGAALSPDEAVAYARRARGARGRPASGWGSLTPTELTVARLAAEGLNNPQIAARLFMSRSTVKTHLAHLYAKLGVANRTGLAAFPAAAGRAVAP